MAVNRVGEAHVCNVWPVGGNVTPEPQRLGLGDSLQPRGGHRQRSRRTSGPSNATGSKRSGWSLRNWPTGTPR